MEVIIDIVKRIQIDAKKINNRKTQLYRNIAKEEKERLMSL